MNGQMNTKENRMKKIIVSMAMIALMGAGCGASESSKPTIAGTNWKLAGWSISSQYPGQFEITASFDDKMISGKSAVNQYNGTYELTDDWKITFGPMMSTKMAGPEEDMRAESNYINLLSSVKRCKIEGGQLLMMDENGNQLLIFSKAQ